jgi:hypothetical protein
VRVKVTLATIVLAILALALPVLADRPETVTICHAAGQAGTTQFVTLTIPVNAAFGQAGHFNEDGTPRAGHEDDYLGECIVTTTTTVAETTTTQAEVTTTTAGSPGPGPEATTTTLPFDQVGPEDIVLSTPEVPGIVVIDRPAELPYTGFDPALLAGAAGLLATTGAGLVRRSRG